MHSARISGIDLLGERITPKLSLYMTKCLGLPWKKGLIIKDYLKVPLSLHQMIIVISLFTIFIRIFVYELLMPMKFLDNCDSQTIENENNCEPFKDSDSYHQEAIEYQTYHVELRNDMAFHATQFIIISSYDKIAMFLWTVHKSFTRKSI